MEIPAPTAKQARREMLAELNQPDAQKIRQARQAREHAAEVLHARKPRGGGAIHRQGRLNVPRIWLHCPDIA